jgi:hypothetical protein
MINRQIKKYKLIVEVFARSERQAKFLMQQGIRADCLAEGISAEHIEILKELNE